jgi:hypothetical protein
VNKEALDLGIGNMTTSEPLPSVMRLSPPASRLLSFGKVRESLEFPLFFIFISFGTVFCCIVETLTMETVRGQRRAEIQSSGFTPSYSKTPVSENQVNHLKIREFISWLVCFTVIGCLTGIMKFLKLGITAESITSALFYISVLAVAYFTYRIISLSRNPVPLKSGKLHELN